LHSWADKNLEAALDYWKNDMGLSHKRDAHSLMYTFARKQPESAILWATENDMPAHIIQSMVSSITSENPKLAEQLLASIEHTQIQSNLIESIALNKANGNIQNARNWLAQYANHKNHQKIESKLFQQWIHIAPEEAANEVLSLTNNTNNYIDSLVSSWQRNDKAAAKQWVLALNRGLERDKALVSFANNIFRRSVDEAIEMAQHIENEQLREQTLMSLTQRINK